MTTPELQARFQTLVDGHRKLLYKVCNAYCKNHHDREDLAQEIMVQLWRSFGSFDERYRFSTWMYRIALNVAISCYRREHRRTRHMLTGDERLLEIADETPGRSQELQMLRQFIQKLEPLNKALLLLYLDDNSYVEIAEVLGISESNVATKLSRLKKSLRQKFHSN